MGYSIHRDPVLAFFLLFRRSLFFEVFLADPKMGARTHVANATRYNIWAQCNSDRHIITEASQKVADSYSEEYKKIFADEDSASAGNIYIRRGRKWGTGAERSRSPAPFSPPFFDYFLRSNFRDTNEHLF